MRLATAATALLGLLLLGGCAGPSGQYQELPQPEQAAVPHHELTEVPFHPQEAYHCGPAALATVLEHTGVDTNPDRLADSVYLPERYGTLQTELLVATRRHDHVPYLLAPSLEAILEEVAAGNPVLVLQNLGLGFWPRWHYAVVVGFDLAQNGIILRSGRTERQVRSVRYFERTWELADHWAIVAMPPNRLPATAQPRPWLESVAALEDRDRLEAARIGYQTATDRWPDQHSAWFGLGNIYYHRGAYAEAAEHYRRAIELQPDNAAAFHNLAWALAQQEHLEEALDAGHRGETLAPEHPVYGDVVDRLPGATEPH